MKKLIFRLGICLLLLSGANNVFANFIFYNKQCVTNPTGEGTIIELQGKLDGTEVRSGAPVIALKNYSVISITFNNDFGDVTININDVNGVPVYTTVVNTSTCASTCIPVDGLSVGNYTVTISNNTGIASGDFSKN